MMNSISNKNPHMLYPHRRKYVVSKSMFLAKTLQIVAFFFFFDINSFSSVNNQQQDKCKKKKTINHKCHFDTKVQSNSGHAH